VTDALAALAAPARAVAREMGVEVYVVGGAVRALLEAEGLTDLDLVTVDADALAYTRRLQARLGGRIKSHPEFLAAHLALEDGRSVDVTRARRERYPRPAALPIVEPGTLLEDLARRDFSVNALALPVGEGIEAIVDPFDGRGDLRARRLRVLHERSFVDDPTRILRAVHLEVTRGFRMSPETERLARAPGLFEGLSRERFDAEMERLLCNPARVATTVHRLADLGVVPALDAMGNARMSDLRAALADSRLWAGLPAPRPWPPLRLLLAGERSARAAALAAPALAPSVVAKSLARAGSEELALLASDPSAEVRANTLRHLRTGRHCRLSISGDDLAARGVPPGPRIGRALAMTRAARLDGRIGAGEELEFALAAAETG
jgi:tRNA nucleotidyltransferase (CCA-adding enzyme)